eukprot:CAMPEP_0114668698 /NCGR_PEP_ID=MMETSP0191-20121206/36730_1 /TAXON_ID=126664 /ORGANISM="Sorites sp." /LENGTH=254 /DNA_ID=CAMNT_0001922425 /DNA_START=54 /DNA_END=818 /DNA_ORIENTATION=+
MGMLDLLKRIDQVVFARPFLVLGVNIVLMLIVPVLARLAGNNDPDANAISHVFGQASICVAMDFPGWFEAAGTIFFFTGIVSGYAVYKVYAHCKELWGGKQIGLTIFMGIVIVMMNLFWMVGLFNPVLNHSYGTVLAHTLPYLGMQLAFYSLIIFEVIMLPPVCGKCRKVTWYILVSLGLLGQTLVMSIIVYTLIDFASHPHETGVDQYKGPLNRYQLTFLEPLNLFFRWLSLMIHPLNVRKPTEEKVEAKEEP